MNKAKDVSITVFILLIAAYMYSCTTNMDKNIEGSRQEAYEQGLEEGYDTGYQEGYDSGYEEGKEAEWNNFIEEYGYPEDIMNDSFLEGYKEGYAYGYDDASNGLPYDEEY